MDTDVLIIGAGPAGLATAATLQAVGISVTVVERAPAVGASWRDHYRRLHLHTVKELSALPGLPFPATAPRYVPRQGVVDYLEAYARHFGIAPRTGFEVASIQRDGGHWCVQSAAGEAVRAPQVVVATGANAWPRAPRLPGAEVFSGRVLHSHAYREATPFQGQRVLVVGMGNTGAEIALDLCEQGVAVALSVRSPVNIVYRDVLGRPTQRTSLMLARLPPRWGERAACALRDLTVGDLSRWGLRTPKGSPLGQLRDEGRTPVIDVGTVRMIKAGRIAVFGGVDTLTADGVRFVEGRQAPFDAVILATGYEAGLARLFPSLPIDALDLDDRGLPRRVSGTGAAAGLHFVGFDIRQPGGLLRTIAAQAEMVAPEIATALRASR